MAHDTSMTQDMLAMVELARRHPDELAALKASLAEGDSDPPSVACDRFDRPLRVGSPVLTPEGVRGRVIRFDRSRKRALIELDRGGTRTLMLSRVELRRGRPRKASYAVSEADESVSA